MYALTDDLVRTWPGFLWERRMTWPIKMSGSLLLSILNSSGRR